MARLNAFVQGARTASVANANVASPQSLVSGLPIGGVPCWLLCSHELHYYVKKE